MEALTELFVRDEPPHEELTMLYPSVGHFPMGANDPLIATIFRVDKDETGFELIQRLLPVFYHDVTSVNPVMTGFAPLPYESKVIGDPDVPDLETEILP